MNNQLTFINQSVDLGIFSMCLRDQFQMYIEGWIEPFEDVNQPRVPFNFGEDTTTPYVVEAYVAINEYMTPIASFSSTDSLGINGEPSILLYSGKTSPGAESTKSSIAIDSNAFADSVPFRYIDNLLFSLIIKNPEGIIMTVANARIINTFNNYSPVKQ